MVRKRNPDDEANPNSVNWPDVLVSWFEEQARDLPWRRNHDPYHVWLSEVMLQQTQVDRVMLYFERWLARFPDIESVAKAPVETILSVWQGLGYYSRARNFQRAARIVVDEHAGQVPDRYEDLIGLPGVGPYTAGAILAFAFNKPFPTIEANTERVYARLMDIDENLKQRSVIKKMQQRLTDWIPPGRARLFNQGLMELGSLVCTPKRPRCPQCPLARVCLAHQRGTEKMRPILPPKAARIEVESLALVILSRDGRILLFQRSQSGLWAGFWELPNKEVGKETDNETTSKKQTERNAALSGLLSDLEPILSQDPGQPDPSRVHRIGSVRHSYTRYSAKVRCHLLALDRSPKERAPGAAKRSSGVVADRPYQWVPFEELSDIPMHAGHRKCVKLLERWLQTHPEK